MKYSKVIFVGDSRTAGMKATLNKQVSSSVTSDVSFIAKAGQGLSWFQSTGYTHLINEINKTKGSKPIAVVSIWASTTWQTSAITSVICPTLLLH